MYLANYYIHPWKDALALKNLEKARNIKEILKPIEEEIEKEKANLCAHM